MCAIFGFVRSKGSAKNVDIVNEIVAGNICRGPQAYGFAWIDGVGRMKMFKSEGKLTASNPVLKKAATEAIVFVGHLRWATHGDLDNLNNHPHPCDGGWLVHNGVIRAYRSIVAKYDLDPNTECDSELIGLCYEKTIGRIAPRMAAAVNMIDDGSPLTCAALFRRHIVIARRTNPLHLSFHRGGTWFASNPDGLPGEVYEVPDDFVMHFAQRKPTDVASTAMLKHDVRAGQLYSGLHRGGYRGG